MSLKETKSLITTMCSNIDNDLGDKPVFVTLKQKFGCKPSHVCVGLVVLICTLSIFDIAGDILTTLFGMIYPAYMSFKVNNDLVRQWRKKTKNKWVFGWLTGSFLDCLLLWMISSASSSIWYLASMPCDSSCMYGCFSRGPTMGRWWFNHS